MLIENFESVFDIQEEATAGDLQTPSFSEAADCSPEQTDSFQNEILPLTDSENNSAYCGPSLQKLEYEVEQATKDLEWAEKNLQTAMDNGAGVLTAMSLVDSRRDFLDLRLKQYSEAVNATAQDAVPLGTKSTSETDGIKLGSVCHKQWELEQAIESGNPIAIEHRQRDLANEIAKEEAKKLQNK